MSDQPEQVDNTESVETPPEQTSTEETPPWYSTLEEVPESLRTVLEPHFKSYTEAQESKYKELEEKYTPWKDIFEQYEIDDAQKALNFAQNFDQNPLDTFKAIKEFLVEQKLLEEEAAPTAPATQAAEIGADEDEDEDDEDEDPRFSKLETQMKSLLEMNAQLAEAFNSQTQMEQQEKQQAQLNEYLEGLEGQYGKLDRDFMVAKLANGVDGEAAAKQYRDSVTAAAQDLNAPAESAPPVIGGGGTLPSNQVSPTQLSNSQTKDLVKELLDKANQVSGQ